MTHEQEFVVRRALILALSLILVVSANGAANDRCIQQTRYWGGDGPAQHLVVVDGHAFFGGYTLRVADLADPTDPRVVHEVRLGGYATDLEVKDDRIYVTDFSDEMTVIDAGVPYQASIEGRSGWKNRDGSCASWRFTVTGAW